jgi:cytoskeletal protein RodZ
MITIGERLAQERRKQHLTIEEIAKATKIREKFLEALEKGEYYKLPSSAYIQGFIKNYAEFLGLPVKETLALFRREFDEREFLGVLPTSFTKPKRQIFPGFRLGTTPVIIGMIFFIIIGFIFYQYRFAFFNPSISIVSPKENEIITTQTITVIGKTDANVTITINDAPVFLDKDGNFKKDITLFTGNASITIKVVNNFGRKSLLVRHVIVKLHP